MSKHRGPCLGWLVFILGVRIGVKSQVCDSLSGPKCAFVNGLEAAGTPRESEQVSSSWRERLLGLVQTHLKQGLESEDGEEPISGAFAVYGTLPRDDGVFELVAGEWVDQPVGWISVGLLGTHEDNCTLTGEITDETGAVMEACSRFTLQRVEESSPDGTWEETSLVGEWEGVYICAGTPTRLVLTLEADHSTFASEIVGIFEFSVLQNLNEFELREITRLVGESLLDLRGGKAGARHGDDIIIIAAPGPGDPAY